jgi:hypothetical protein
MKKLLWFVLVIALAAGMAACGDSNEGVVVDPNASAGQPAQSPASASGSAAATTAEALADTLYYDANGVIVHVFDKADDALGSLGEPSGTFEAASCAYQGMDYFYYYDGFQLTVNDIEGTKRVTTITVVDDTVSIPQGVKIGSTQDEMLRLMGSNYTESAGLYAFTEGDTTLQIQIKEGKVASMLYVYTPQS